MKEMCCICDKYEGVHMPEVFQWKGLLMIVIVPKAMVCNANDTKVLAVRKLRVSSEWHQHYASSQFSLSSVPWSVVAWEMLMHLLVKVVRDEKHIAFFQPLFVNGMIGIFLFYSRINVDHNVFNFSIFYQKINISQSYSDEFNE